MTREREVEADELKGEFMELRYFMAGERATDDTASASCSGGMHASIWIGCEC